MLKAKLLAKDKLPYLILIVILLLYIFYLQACTSCDKIKPAQPSVTTKTIVKHKTDTVYLPQKTRTIKGTTKKIVTLKDSSTVYKTTLEDSLLTAIITSRVTGKLDDIQLEYTPKFPKYIHTIDSVFTTNTITVEKLRNSRSIALGIDIGGNLNMFTGSAFIQYSDRKQFIYGFRYDVVNKTYNIQLGKRFNLEK